MEQDQFITLLAREAFQETATVQREANGFMEIHTHPFEAKALILQGQLHITSDGVERSYRTGDVFHLAANQPHAERYGDAGVTYLVGRK